METLSFQGVSDAELQAVTGKTWKEWCELLDSRQNPDAKLSSITHYLIQQQRLRRLWAQMIAVYYRLEWCSSHPF